MFWIFLLSVHQPINFVDIRDVEFLEQALLEHDENAVSINSDSTEPLPEIGPEKYNGASLQAEGDRIIPANLDILSNLLFRRQATVVRGILRQPNVLQFALVHL